MEWALKREKRLTAASGRHRDNPELIAEMEREITDCSGFTYHNIENGDVFDLGGITVKAIHVPGHTLGAMVFYCEADNILCTGDAVGRVVLLGRGSN